MQQTANVHGQENVVVQIVGDANAVTIAGATALRLVSYADFAEAPADPARAGKAGYTATGRRETRILYPYNRASLPFQGREELLARLKAWLVADGAVSVQALVGRGGSGKTRFAVEIADWARAQDPGWTAGFARQADLDVFRAAGCRTAWTEPCLVVVDYAAAKGVELGNWLDALAHEKPAKPLRLLLLERTGGGGIAWWRALFGRPGADGEAVADLLAAEAPLAVAALGTPEERHAVFAAAFAQASGQNPPARSGALDQALLDASLGGEPLFLGMFGLTAAREGLAATRGLNADAIALRLAEQELVRIGRVWQAHGLLVGKERALHERLAAAATLCEGLSEAETHAAIARESAALNQAIAPGQTEAARAALHAALPAEADGGLAPIIPDILGEAVAICALRDLPDGGVEAVRRAAQGRRAAVTRTVVRACQDFLIRDQRAPLAWLQALQTDAADLEALKELHDALPVDTIELREVAVALTEQLLRGARELPDDEGAALRALSLNNLSIRLAALGRREEALAAIKEAVELRRALAAARPDAFRPDLASSLNNLSNRLADLGRREEALAAIEEAVEILRALAAARPLAFAEPLATSLWVRVDRLEEAGDLGAAVESDREALVTLAPLFQRHPAALSGKAGEMAREYVERCERAGVEPDEGALAAVMAVFEAMRREDEAQAEE